MAFTDGTFTTAKQNGPRRKAFPFMQSATPDITACVYDRNMVVYPVTSYSPGLADRTSVTNLLTYSEAFDNAAWTKTSATVSANTVANPMDAATTADSLLEAAASAEHTITQAGTIAASAATFSVCVKALGRNYCRLKITDSAASAKAAFFDLSTGVVGTVDSGATSAIVQVASGWYRCSITFTSPAAGAATCSIQPSTDGSTVSYLGTTSTGLYLFGAQLQQLSSASAYAATTSATRTISAPNLEINETLDGSDPFAYLVGESEVDAASGVGYFRRTHARIPGSQTNYPGSRYIGFPTITNKYGSSSTLTVGILPQGPTGTSFGAGYYMNGSAYTSGDNKLYRTKLITGTVYAKATAGTFTITYGANTTAALNYNDSAATIKTAVDALASVTADGITTTWVNNLSTNGTMAITITIVGTIPTNWPKYFTMTATGLTVSTSKNPVTTIVTGNLQYIYLPDHHTITSHGFDTAKRLVLGNNGTNLAVAESGSWGSIDANTIWFATVGGTTTGYASFAGDFTADIDPSGVRLVRTRTVETFSLPGVTTGITTPADITVSTGMQNPTDFYYALANSTGWQTYETQGPAKWNDSQIYRLETTEVNLSDFY